MATQQGSSVAGTAELALIKEVASSVGIEIQNSAGTKLATFLHGGGLEVGSGATPIVIGATAGTISATAFTGAVPSASIPDPYVPVDGTMNVTGGLAVSTVITTPALTHTPAVVPASAAGATTITWSAGLVQTHTLTENVTYTFAGSVSGQTLIVAVTNTVGNYTVTWPTISWVGGSAPTQTTGAHTDIYSIIKIGSTFYGTVVQNF